MEPVAQMIGRGTNYVKCGFAGYPACAPKQGISGLYPTDRSIGRGQTPLGRPIRGATEQEIEYAFHRIDAREIAAHIVIAAPLAFEQMKAAFCKGITGTGTAKMDHRRQLLLVLERSRRYSVPLEDQRDMVIEVGRCQLDRVTRHHPGIEAVEPARMPVIPGPILRDGVIVDAIVPRFRKRSVGYLIHPDGARCRPVHLERLCCCP